MSFAKRTALATTSILKIISFKFLSVLTLGDVVSILEKGRAHHAQGTTDVDELHNEQHSRINIGLKRFKGGGGGKQVARGIAEDATQLKITANLLDADGNEHLDKVKKTLNEDLQDGDKFVLSNGKTS